MFYKIKIRKADRLFSQLIRARDKYTCQRCRRKFSPENCRGLVVSHYWGRGRESTRYDEENCVALCSGCHQIWGHGDGREEYIQFMKERLGSRFDILMVRAYTYQKRDDKLNELWIKERLNEL
jgi:hypothetical protein